ncbi:MAG: histone H1-like repetitive region-containing protein [Polyangiales bacterium]
MATDACFAMVVKKPAAKKPAAKKPAAKKPAAKKPAAKKPAAKKPATKKPAAKKPAAKRADLSSMREAWRNVTEASLTADLDEELASAWRAVRRFCCALGPQRVTRRGGRSCSRSACTTRS